jgi:hypothetical protein
MSLKKRIAFFAFGLIIGIIFVKIIFGKKDVTFDYLPNDRVLKTLKTKQRVFNDNAYQFFMNEQIDTSAVELFLEKGDVNFSESKQRQKPCNFYQIEKEIESKTYAIYVKNCDTLVTVEKAFKISEK